MDEISAIAAELRQYLEDLQARGVRTLPRESARPAAVDNWTATARAAREGPPGGAAALQRVRDELGECTRCGLCKGRNTIVFGVGDPSADLVIVGEGPGAQEDQRGEPFVGPAGQMLDKMLENVLGLKRSQVYILNVVKCRPPGNRNPSPEEIAACRPFLEGQLAALQPRVMLVLGSVAFKALMDATRGITGARGRWHIYRSPGLEVPVMPTFHPAYLLRTPGDKRKTFEDLKALRVRYDAEGGRR